MSALLDLKRKDRIMWYLPKPNTTDLNNYVAYMSKKIKESPHYARFQNVLEVNRHGRDIDFVDLLLRAEPERQRKLNRALMKRIFGKAYQEKHLRQLTEINKKASRGKQLGAYEQRIYNTYHDDVDELRKLFNYGSWISGDKDYSYSISRIKHTNVCPYCNRQYTLTIEHTDEEGNVVEHIAKPHFDHWYPKEAFPLLALSFYNLVPSCSVCNSSIKGNIVMGASRFVHPYNQPDGYEPGFHFRVLFRGDMDFELYETRPTDRREENMLKAFYLQDAYKYHEHLEVEDLVKLQRAYSGRYLSKLMKNILNDLLPKMNVREIIRIVFGAEIDAAHMNDRPLSKLKKDLLVQFRVIDNNGNLHPDLQGT